MLRTINQASHGLKAGDVVPEGLLFVTCGWEVGWVSYCTDCGEVELFAFAVLRETCPSCGGPWIGCDGPPDGCLFVYNDS